MLKIAFEIFITVKFEKNYCYQNVKTLNHKHLSTYL